MRLVTVCRSGILVCLIVTGIWILSVLKQDDISNFKVSSKAPANVEDAIANFSLHLERVRFQNDQVYFNQRQVDEDTQHLADPVIPSNERLENMLQAEKISKLKSTVSKEVKLKDHNLPNIETDFHSIDSNERYLLYSAHYDDRHSMVKIVGIGPMSDDHKNLAEFNCHVTDGSNSYDDVPLAVYYRISTFVPWEGQQYDSYIFMCNTSLSNPVSITVESNKAIGSKVTLEINSKASPNKFKFAVCVEPLTLHFSDEKSIMHYIAVNSMFGAEHFYFYLTNASQDVIQLLYSLPMVTVYPWRLGNLQKLTHSSGQKASNAHCLYHHRHSAEYLAFIDIDEVLVPRIHGNWSSMLDYFNTEYPNQGAVVIQSKVFPRNMDISKNDFICNNSLWSIGITKTAGVFNLYEWSKVLASTKKTDVVDIHRVREMIPGFEVVNADPTIALVHHYREYNAEKILQDTHMIRYTKILMDLYQEMFQNRN